MADDRKAIPAIDLQGFPGESRKLIEACEEWGCFRLVNFEGVLPQSLMSEMKEVVVRELLALPTEIKVRNKAVIAGSGYMAPSEINPLYEGLGLYDMACGEAVDSFCSTLEATPNHRDIIQRYAKAVHQLQTDIAGKIGQGLGVNSATFEDWVSQFRINKYSFTPQTVGSSGVQLHTDSSFLTILQDDEHIGGLEVMTRTGHFQPVDPCPGTLVVNLGDIATVWSNGRFLNVKHRVMCKEAGTRLSIASFLLGPKVGMVEAPPELVDSERPRLFSHFTYEEFRNFRISKKMNLGEALDHFKLWISEN